MTVLVNGRAASHTSAADRGLLYGQTVFETVAVAHGAPLLFERHLARLRLGAHVIGIPFDQELTNLITNDVRTLIDNLVNGDAIQQTKAVLRITLSMGEGGRGYRNPAQIKPTRILSLHTYPGHPDTHWQQGIMLGLVSIKLAHQPALAGIKHGNRLEQVIARSQWREGWHEALVLDQNDRVIEGTQSNVFIVKNGNLKTPDLRQCGVAGVMRETVIEQAQKLGVHSEIVSLSVSDIEAADEVFMTNSVIGLWPVERFQSTRFGEPKLAFKLLTLLTKNEVIPHL